MSKKRVKMVIMQAMFSALLVCGQLYAMLPMLIKTGAARMATILQPAIPRTVPADITSLCALTKAHFFTNKMLIHPKKVLNTTKAKRGKQPDCASRTLTPPSKSRPCSLRAETFQTENLQSFALKHLAVSKKLTQAPRSIDHRK